MSITVFLCGDVMLGRGVDQILPHPSAPGLREICIRDARDYVALAEDLNGPIERPVDPSYVWGAALGELARAAPVARLINLETAVTTSHRYWPDKEIHYRLHPANVACLTSARIDACSLANNHVLDFGRRGLIETVEALRAAGVRTAGAGRHRDEARSPARVPLEGGGAVLLFGMGSESSGIPWGWAAGEASAGLDLLPDLSAATAARVVDRVRSFKRPGDLAIASIHWGGNWGYAVPPDQVLFAHRLIEGGVDLVHGHSSHHPRPIEIYRGKLVLHGCGDFINDYEGITGYESFRDDLRLMYFATLEAGSGGLEALRMVALQAHRFSLRRARPADVRWLAATLSEASRPFGIQVVPSPGGELTLQAGAPATSVVQRPDSPNLSRRG